MALIFARVQQEADAIQALAQRMVVLHADVLRVLEHNSDQAIDWAAAVVPDYIEEDVTSGNLSGVGSGHTYYPYTRQMVANAIGSLDWFRKLLTNQDMTGSQGDHLGNLNLLAEP